MPLTIEAAALTHLSLRWATPGYALVRPAKERGHGQRLNVFVADGTEITRADGSIPEADLARSLLVNWRRIGDSNS